MECDVIRKNELREKIILNDEISITSINSMFIYHFDMGYKLHYFDVHDALELIYVDDGVEEVYEENVMYEVKKGEAFLHKSNTPHKDGCISKSSHVYIISFEADEKQFAPFFDRIIKLEKKDDLLLKEVFETYINNMESSNSFWFSDHKNVSKIKNPTFGIKQIIKNKLELFFLGLLNPKQEETNKTISTRNSPVVNQVIKVLKEMIEENFSLDKIASKLSYSKSYLCRQFKKETGSTIINYFYTIKIEEAKKLLFNDNYTIAEVSDKLGFDSVQYFSKVFKKYCGLSPAVWKTIALKREYF